MTDDKKAFEIGFQKHDEDPPGLADVSVAIEKALKEWPDAKFTLEFTPREWRLVRHD